MNINIQNKKIIKYKVNLMKQYVIMLRKFSS